MKYTRKKLTAEVNDWTQNQSEYFRILAFVHDVFKEIDFEINVDIPAPIVKKTQFHFNTKRYTFCVDDPKVIYLNEKDYGLELHAALITALFNYYAKNLYPTDAHKASEVVDKALDELSIVMTVGEIAKTSTIVVTGLLVGKAIFSKLF